MSKWACTVLVPTYRHAELIAEAIASVARQTVFDRCRVIVSDDQSPDATFANACQAAAGLQNVEVRRNDANLGVMAHYLHLIGMVETPFVAILEGDDAWLTPEKLDLQLAFLEAHPTAAMCFAGGVVLDERTGEQRRFPRWDDGRYRYFDCVDFLYDNPVATFSTCLYRSEVLRDVFALSARKGGYDWLCSMLIARDRLVGFVPGAHVQYRLHDKGAWTALTREEQGKAIRNSLAAFRDLARPGLAAFVDDAVRLAGT